MPRLVTAFVAAGLLLACAPAARAQGPAVTVTIQDASATPWIGAGVEGPRGGGTGPYVIIDGCMCDGGPSLVAAPGDRITIAVAAPVEALTAYAGTTQLALSATSAMTYEAQLPADLVLPTRLGMRVEYGTPEMSGHVGRSLKLVAAAPVVPAAPAPVAAVPAPEPAATVASVRFNGRRIAATVACPAAATSGCAGTLTLRTSSLRIARLTFTGVKAGMNRTISATVRTAALRHLRRHRITALRALFAAPGKAPAASRVAIR